MVRVRIAPSPTGDPHIGWARTALFNWYFARHEGGILILRIEDTDQKRTHQGAVEAFDDALRWMGFFYDEGPTTGGPKGPYVQSERKALHSEALGRILEAGLAYPCFCTPEELEQRRNAMRKEGKAPRYDGRCRGLDPDEAKRRMASGERFVYRLKVDGAGSVLVQDLIRGEVAFDLSTVDDFVIVKADGTATYNFAVVVDDAGMEISHVIRGEEHLSNTPKQLLIYRALGLTPPLFAHIPMVLAPDRSKLSKRHGATALSEFRDLGFLPEALVNYISLLGWHPGGEEEIFSLDEAARRFELTHVQKNAAIYDVKKLTWMNGQYLRALPAEDLYERALPFLEGAGLLQRPLSAMEADYARRVVLSVRERVSTLVEVADAAAYFFKDVTGYDEKGARKHFEREGAAARLRALAEALAEAPSFSREDLEDLYTCLAEDMGIGRGELIHPTRLAVTGRTMGPGLFDILEILGRDTVLKRLQAAAQVARP